MLTEKELNFLSELITFEDNAYKKADCYAKSCQDESLCSLLGQIAKCHKSRKEKLIERLK